MTMALSGDDVVGGGGLAPYISRTMSEPGNTIGGTPRAIRRPVGVKPPAGWTSSPLPAPAPLAEDKPEDQPGGRNPVRYGDWELKGIAIDF
ncbi:DUF1674 domain-containing protein [Sphingopyxis sp.]|uniref:DUF1674 domain-containing protein n=1 Tax=Sphingopyxis sp. TaxID=1908224 RepID=UPI003D811B67